MIIHNRILPFGRSYIAINLFGIIFAKKWLSERTIRHERIHTRQQLEMLFVPFYVWYVAEWLVRLVMYRNARRAYFNISFEREAYANEHNSAYLHHRRWYNWMRYLGRD